MELLALALIWGAVLVKWAWSRRSSFSDPVNAFTQELTVLERTAPVRFTAANSLRGTVRRQASFAHASRAYWPQAAPSKAEMKRRQIQRRRRDVLTLLLGLAAFTLLVAVVAGSKSFLYIQLLADAALISYVYLLVRMKSAREQRPGNIAYLPRAKATAGRDSGYPELALRQAAN